MSDDSSEFYCPGAKSPISRAVHLGRLAAFDPACRQCPHRNVTGSLSPRQVARFEETTRRDSSGSLFSDEGVVGAFWNELTPAIAARVAAAFGTVVLRQPQPAPSILLANDGRPLVAELVAAVAEGLRSTGCDVIDIGTATAGCTAFAVDRLKQQGGVFVGNPGRDSHTAGLKFWTADARPVSRGGMLEAVFECYESGQAVVARRHGSLRRRQAEAEYLAEFAPYYHALRPLRVAIDSASHPFVAYLEKLVSPTECKIIPSRNAASEPDKHLAIVVDGDGETCQAFDERGRPLSAEQLLLLLAAYLRPAAVVLESDTAAASVDRLRHWGIQVTENTDRRADMYAAMVDAGATLGGGPSGRMWRTTTGRPMPDALMTVTRLLELLSRTDDPLSALLDR